MRQHDRVGLGVRQVEHAAEHVADLVVQPGPGGGERDRGQVGAVERLLAAVESGRGRRRLRGRPARSARMPSAASAWSIGSVRGAHIESTQWASAFRPEATLRSTGSDSGQRGVVDDRAGQHPRVDAGGLACALGQPPDVGGLGPGVRGRHRDDRQAGGERDRLGQAGGRAAADADERVDAVLGGGRRGPARRPRPARASTTSLWTQRPRAGPPVIRSASSAARVPRSP